MNIVLIFEVEDDTKAQTLKAKLKEKGYLESWKNENKVLTLPKNCMWKQDTELENSDAEFSNILRENSITANSYLILPAVPYIGLEKEAT